MIQLRRILSALIDLSIYAVVYGVVIAVIILFTQIWSSSDVVIYYVVIIVMILWPWVLSFIFNLDRQRNPELSRLDVLKKRWFYLYPFVGRSIGMKVAGIYACRNGYELTYSDLELWRRTGFLNTVYTFGLFYLVMFFGGDASTVYDQKLDVTVVDKESFDRLKGTHEDFLDDVGYRAPIIKKDKK